MQQRQSNKAPTNLAAVGNERRRLEAAENAQSRRESALQLQRLRHTNVWDDRAAATKPTPEDAKAATLRLQQAVSAQVTGQQDAAEHLLEAAQDLGQLLSSSGDDVLSAAVDGSAVQALLAAVQLNAEPAPEVAAVVVHVLTYMVSGDQTAASQCAQGVPLAVQLLQHPQLSLAERCAALLGSLAEGSLEWRLALAHQGSTAALAQLLVTAGAGILAQDDRNERSTQLCQTAAWALSSSLRSIGGHVTALLGQVPGILPVLLAMVGGPDGPLAREAAWVLAGLTAGPHEAVQHLLEAGIVPALARLLIEGAPLAAAADSQGDVSPRQHALAPLMHSLSNVISTADAEKLHMRELAGTEAAAVQCLGLSHRGICKEAALLIAALARHVGLPAQRALVATDALPALAARVVEGALDLRREAAAGLLELCRGPEGSGEPLIVEAALQEREGGVLAGMLHLLRSPDYDAARVALQFVELVLRLTSHGPQLVEEGGGIDALEQLQYRGPPDLQERAGALVDTYYGEDYGLEEHAQEHMDSSTNPHDHVA